MPRQKRLLGESKFYHVMIRGNDKKEIFLDNADRFYFIKLLFNKSDIITIIAYCLMDNHVHFLLYDPNDMLSKMMQSLNISYAMYFNEKYSRTGHLLQDRFKSEIINDERRLMAAIRYIHNNPVKANICANPGEYKWSSYQYYMQTNPNPKIPVFTDIILDLYSSNRTFATERFRIFSHTESDEMFIDINDKKLINSEQEARDYLHKALNKYSINREDLKKIKYKYIRNKIINELKEQSALSIRKIAKILDLDRNIVQRN